MGTPLGTAMENDDTGKVIAYSLAVGIPYGNKVLSLEEDHTLSMAFCPWLWPFSVEAPSLLSLPGTLTPLLTHPQYPGNHLGLATSP